MGSLRPKIETIATRDDARLAFVQRTGIDLKGDAVVSDALLTAFTTEVSLEGVEKLVIAGHSTNRASVRRPRKVQLGRLSIATNCHEESDDAISTCFGLQPEPACLATMDPVDTLRAAAEARDLEIRIQQAADQILASEAVTAPVRAGDDLVQPVDGAIALEIAGIVVRFHAEREWQARRVTDALFHSKLELENAAEDLDLPAPDDPATPATVAAYFSAALTDVEALLGSVPPALKQGMEVTLRLLEPAVTKAEKTDTTGAIVEVIARRRPGLAKEQVFRVACLISEMFAIEDTPRSRGGGRLPDTLADDARVMRLQKRLYRR